MIRPALQDDMFLDAIRAAQARPGLRLWWLGQSGFLIQYKSAHLLLDPYLSDSLTKKYAHTDKPHVRMTERVIDPARLDFIDAVTSSHNHTDHLDGETLIPLMQVNPAIQVVVGRANLAFAAERLQVSPQRLTAIFIGAPVQIGPFTVYALPSAHERLENDAAGEPRFLGFVVQAGPWSLYHSGDCIPYPGLVERLQAWKIDVALLPINGRDPSRGVAGNFSGEEAAALAKAIAATTVVPMHYEMFAFNTVTPDEFIAAAGRLGQAFRLLRAGEMLALSDTQASA